MIVAIENNAIEGGEKQRIRIRILSYLNLEKLVDAEGATWRDKELIGKSQERLAQTGFGSTATAAIAQRWQWLVTQRLCTIDSANAFRPQPRMIEQLRRRDLRQARQILSKELGLADAQPGEGDRMKECSVALSIGQRQVCRDPAVEGVHAGAMEIRDGAVQG